MTLIDDIPTTIAGYPYLTFIRSNGLNNIFIQSELLTQLGELFFIAV